MSNIPTLLTLIANEVRRIKAIIEPASNANALIEPLSFLTGTLNLLTDKISELQSAYDSNARELQALAVSFDGMEKERDKFAKEIEGLKSDVRSAEAAYERLAEANELLTEQRDGYKLQRDGAEIALGKIAKLAANPDDVVDASFDPGAPEGDKTVVSWKCTCGTRHIFEPPRSSYWSYSSECSTCGSKISLSPLSV